MKSQSQLPYPITQLPNPALAVGYSVPFSFGYAIGCNAFASHHAWWMTWAYHSAANHLYTEYPPIHPYSTISLWQDGLGWQCLQRGNVDYPQHVCVSGECKNEKKHAKRNQHRLQVPPDAEDVLVKEGIFFLVVFLCQQCKLISCFFHPLSCLVSYSCEITMTSHPRVLDRRDNRGQSNTEKRKEKQRRMYLPSYANALGFFSCPFLALSFVITH